MKWFLLLALIFLVGCTCGSETPRITKTSSIEGCDTYLVEPQWCGERYYVTKCKNNTKTEWKHRAGKTTFPRQSETVIE